MTEGEFMAYTDAASKLLKITASMKKLASVGAQSGFSEGWQEGLDAALVGAEPTVESAPRKVLQAFSVSYDRAIADLETQKIYFPPSWMEEFIEKHGDWSQFIADLRRDWQDFEDARQRFGADPQRLQ